jgi:hypothetical protein
MFCRRIGLPRDSLGSTKTKQRNRWKNPYASPWIETVGPSRTPRESLVSLRNGVVVFRLW